jgi:hypothetical protein
MIEYRASRLSQGNLIFPKRLTLNANGVTITQPGFLSGTEEDISYNKLATVKVDTPFIGFSKVILNSTGKKEIVIHGFTAKDAKEIKKNIVAQSFKL